MSRLILCAKQTYVNSKHSFAAYRSISGFGTSTPFRKSSKVEHKGFDKALKVLDFVIQRARKVGRDDRHQRLIQSCMRDLSESGEKKCSKIVNKTAVRESTESKNTQHDQNFDGGISTCWSREIWEEENSFLLFQKLYKRGISREAATLSSLISSCGTKGALDTGLRLHAFTVKIGFYGCNFIGSSLISLYSKCGKLGSAYRVFEEMPMKNTVSWTSLITGYAQHGELETCLNLFHFMRHSNSNPNDFTYASLISVCTNHASLALGRSFHCLVIRVGYGSYTHVSNALISMYAKCGVIEEARFVFEKLPCKDLISWNSMIFGYAHYGTAEEALDLLKEMDQNDILPDAITFLGVLSSCRHAGLVDKGRHCFDLMLRYGIRPELDHYSCIVDLLGRAGLLEEAVDFIEKMPVSPNAVIWGSLLSSCRVHGKAWIGIHAAESRLLLEPGCAATYVQLANLYASIGCWNNVAMVRKSMKERGLKTSPGSSWIEIGNKLFRFKAEDGANSELQEMLMILDMLGDHMQCLKCMVQIPFDGIEQVI